jgi:F420-dependent methylenetetrahydromethanopterin dehydrogenase
MELKQPIYRGGNQFIAKTNEVKIEPKTGFLKPTNGISVNLDPNKVRRFGGAYRIIDLPDTLKIIQRGRDPQHYEIVPRAVNLLTFEQFNEELRKIQAIREE